MGVMLDFKPTQMQKLVPALGYVRVSEGEPQLMADDQDRRIRLYAEQHGFQVTAVYADLAALADAPLYVRSGLLDMLDAVAATDAKVVIVSRRNRLSTDPMRAALIARLIARDGGRVICTDGIAGAVTPDEKQTEAMREPLDEYDRLLAGMGVRRANNARRRRGEPLGQAPFGYSIDGAQLVANPVEQAAIVRIVALRDQGYSFSTMEQLLQIELPNAVRGNRWHKTSIARIYAAEMRRRSAPQASSWKRG
jgi:DNA invertase Pin-like site-specific DNA recombinase